MNVEELTAWERNPRKNDKAAEKLSSLLSKYGFIDPVIATKDRIIRAGHTRVKAAIKAGITEVPVIFVDFGSEEEAVGYSIADNKASEWADWDEETLRDLLQTELCDMEGLSDMTGFSDTEIAGLTRADLDMGSKTFREMVEAFEREHAFSKEKPLWVWFVVPDRETKDKLMELYGIEQEGKKKGAGGELDWEKLVDKGLYVRKKKSPPRRKKK